MRSVMGIDASFSPISRSTFALLREQFGAKVFVQCAWTGGYENNAGIRAVAETNLANARLEGYSRGVYINANPWFPAEMSLAQAKANVGSEWEALVAVPTDVELKYTLEAHVRPLMELIAAEKPTPMYSAPWFAHGYLGGARWEWLRAFKVWNAHYDQEPDINFASAPWGPWATDPDPNATVVGEQYAGTTDVLDGPELTLLPHHEPICPNDHNLVLAQVDLNIFDSEFWGVTDPMDEIMKDGWGEIVVRVLDTSLPEGWRPEQLTYRQFINFQARGLLVDWPPAIDPPNGHRRLRSGRLAHV